MQFISPPPRMGRMIPGWMKMEKLNLSDGRALNRSSSLHPSILTSLPTRVTCALLSVCWRTLSPCLHTHLHPSCLLCGRAQDFISPPSSPTSLLAINSCHRRLHPNLWLVACCAPVSLTTFLQSFRVLAVRFSQTEAFSFVSFSKLRSHTSCLTIDLRCHTCEPWTVSTISNSLLMVVYDSDFITLHWCPGASTSGSSTRQKFLICTINFPPSLTSTKLTWFGVLWRTPSLNMATKKAVSISCYTVVKFFLSPHLLSSLLFFF